MDKLVVEHEFRSNKKNIHINIVVREQYNMITKMFSACQVLCWLQKVIHVFLAGNHLQFALSNR